MLRRLLSATTLALALTSTACLRDTGVNDPTTFTDPATVTFAPALGVDLASMTKSTTGLYYKDLAVGSGAAATATDSVALNLTGYLSSGEVVADAHTTPPAEARLTLLLPGLQEGMTGMQPGGSRRLVIPPQLAFGFTAQPAAQGYAGIPANSVLVFDVELVAIR